MSALARPPPAPRSGAVGRGGCARLRAEASGGAADESKGGGGGGGRRKTRSARQPGLFEVQDISPPPRSLGIHALPPVRLGARPRAGRRSCCAPLPPATHRPRGRPQNTHNGDVIELEDGSSYVVESLTLIFRLVNGRYQQEHRRLDVNKTGRFLYNTFLESVYAQSAAAPPEGAV
jgi:hypothetical protein